MKVFLSGFIILTVLMAMPQNVSADEGEILPKNNANLRLALPSALAGQKKSPRNVLGKVRFIFPSKADIEQGRVFLKNSPYPFSHTTWFHNPFKKRHKR